MTVLSQSGNGAIGGPHFHCFQPDNQELVPLICHHWDNLKNSKF